MKKNVVIFSLLMPGISINHNLQSQVIVNNQNAAIQNNKSWESKSLTLNADLNYQNNYLLSACFFENYNQIMFNKIVFEFDLEYTKLNYFTHFLASVIERKSFDLNQNDLRFIGELINDNIDVSFKLDIINNLTNSKLNLKILQLETTDYQQILNFPIFRTKIINPRFKIFYKHIIVTQEETKIENLIRHILSNSLNLNLHSLNSGQDVIKALEIYLNGILKLPHQKVTVDLFYKDYNVINFDHSWKVEIFLNDKIVLSSDNQPFFVLLLENTKIINQDIINIYQFLQEFNWDLPVIEKYRNINWDTWITHGINIFEQTLKYHLDDILDPTIKLTNLFTLEIKLFNFNNYPHINKIAKIDILVNQRDSFIYLGTLTLSNFINL